MMPIPRDPFIAAEQAVIEFQIPQTKEIEKLEREQFIEHVKAALLAFKNSPAPSVNIQRVDQYLAAFSQKDISAIAAQVQSTKRKADSEEERAHKKAKTSRQMPADVVGVIASYTGDEETHAPLAEFFDTQVTESSMAEVYKGREIELLFAFLQEWAQDPKKPLVVPKTVKVAENITDLRPLRPLVARLKLPELENLLSFLVTRFPNCTALDIENTQMSQKCFQIIASFKKLTHLKIPAWGEQLVEFITQNMKQLTFLHIDGFRPISDASLTLIHQHLSGLTSFTCCTDDAGLQYIAKHMKQLTSLALTHSGPDVSETAICALVTGLPQLTSLQLHSQFTPNAVKAIAEGLPHLTHLDVSRPYNDPYMPPCVIGDAEVALFATKLRNLVSLDLGGAKITDTGVESIAEHLGSLERLNLRLCYLITDKAAVLIGQCLRRLRSLNLTFCQKLTDQGLRSIAEGVESLVELDLTRCPLITDEGIIALTDHQKELQVLLLGHCNALTDRGLEAISGLRYLTKVVLNCEQITDAGINAFALRVKRLKDLELLDATNITDSTCASIAQNMTQLFTLTITQASKLTRTALETFAAHRKLHFLTIKGLQGVSYKDTDVVYEIKPGIHFVFSREL